MRGFKARLVESFEIAPFTRHFVFEVPSLETLGFVPGQFFSFTREINDRIITRAYSVVSVPQGNRFDLCLNLVEGGKLSPILFDMQPGDEVDVTGPFGSFILREPVDTIMVATGTGVAPFRSMLLERVPQDTSHGFALVFGVRHEVGLLYREELEGLATAHPHFQFLPTLTRPGDTWLGRTGRVQAHVLDLVGDRRDQNIYICGMKEMVDEMRQALKDKGFERKQIVVEKYD